MGNLSDTLKEALENVKVKDDINGAPLIDGVDLNEENLVALETATNNVDTAFNALADVLDTMQISVNCLAGSILLESIDHFARFAVINSLLIHAARHRAANEAKQTVN